MTYSNGLKRNRWSGRSSMTGVLILLSALLAPSAWSEQYEDQKLVPSDGVAHDQFGYFVSVSGDVALVGSWMDDDKGNNSGSVYAYRYDSLLGMWQVEDKLLASDGALGDAFGISVSVEGDVAVIGASGDTDNGTGSGSAYVFRYNSGTGSWIEEDKLVPSDGTNLDQFGNSCSISGNVALVGAYGNDDNGNNSGSAYVFRYDSGTGTWNEEATLIPADNAQDDLFGWSVSLSNDVALIGAFGDDTGSGAFSGSAYVYRYDSGASVWVEEDKLTASDGAVTDFFGWSVSIAGNVAAIGSRFDDDNGSSSGSAYVFRYDSSAGTWPQEAKLVPSDGAASDEFGYSVSVSGDRVVAGARYDDDNGSDSGSAYLFKYDSSTPAWNQDSKLLASDGAAGDELGFDAAVSGKVIFVGAYKDNDKGSDSGSAYVFDFRPKPDIKVNGQDGPLNVSFTQTVTMTISLDPRAEIGVAHDWWVLARRNSAKLFSWKPKQGGVWIKGVKRAYKGPLQALTNYVVHNGTIPAGSYEFAFVVDALDNTFQGTHLDLILVTSN